MNLIRRKTVFRSKAFASLITGVRWMQMPQSQSWWESDLDSELSSLAPSCPLVQGQAGSEAVATMAFSKQWMKMQKLPIAVDDKRMLRIEEGLPEVRGAITWKGLAGDKGHVTERLKTTAS